MANGHRKLLDQLKIDGITRVFGNPGSSEEGLLDELTRFPEIQYVLGLQEAALVLIANGYALATHKPTVVQLHSSVGLGNALGSLYHVFRKQRSPLIVIAGEAGVAYDALEAHMWLDLAGFARPVTKYAARAIHSGSLLRLLRRCIKMAATPPFGPTFLAVPQDVLDQENHEEVTPTIIPETRVAPEPALIARAVDLLIGSTHPVILVGDGVAHAQAHRELARLAEVLGAGVWGAMASEISLPWTHPLYRGLTGHMFGSASRHTVENADAVVICGTYVFPDVFPLTESPFLPDAKVVHIDLDAYAIAKNHPVSLGLVSDPKLTLDMLAQAIEARMTAEQKKAARARAAAIASDKKRTRASMIEGDAAKRSATPLHMSVFAEELAKQLPADAIVFDESLTYSPELTRYVVPGVPGNFFQTPGGTLGIGLPGAVGVKLARPHQTVIGLTGDGGALYTFPALWTAAHHRIGAKFVVCHNRSYRLLKQNLVNYWQEHHSNERDFPESFDIHDPSIDYVSQAKGFGVRGLRVAQIGEISSAIRSMLEDDGPFLLELALEDTV
jgi:thiamine pyrophosphate-dependent acetolactate synthase large subunit-like protein